jgi:oxygen-independent coproporphyrinogen-3 oxidase
LTPDTSIYIHIPFCKHRCAYCDFNTYAGQEDSIPAYVNALINEINYVGQRAEQMNIHTVFFGGGTPSLLSALQFDSILKALRSAFTLTADAEISIEANPGTISPEKLTAIREAGINRISFGVQSANTEELRMLERIHDFFTVIEAVSTARKAGFDNLNLDLIYGLPEQTLASWQTTSNASLIYTPSTSPPTRSLSNTALPLDVGHPKACSPSPTPISPPKCTNTPKSFWRRMGMFIMKYQIGRKRTTQKAECRMQNQIHHSPFINHHLFAVTTSNTGTPSPTSPSAQAPTDTPTATAIQTPYESKLTSSDLSHPSSFSILPFPLSPATVNQHKQSLKDDMSEYMLNNLRLTNVGVAESDFRLRFGSGLLDVYPKEIDELVKNGLLEFAKTSEVYRLTKRGRLLGNQVFVKFV